MYKLGWGERERGREKEKERERERAIKSFLKRRKVFVLSSFDERSDKSLLQLFIETEMEVSIPYDSFASFFVSCALNRMKCILGCKTLK